MAVLVAVTMAVVAVAPMVAVTHHPMPTPTPVLIGGEVKYIKWTNCEYPLKAKNQINKMIKRKVKKNMKSVTTKYKIFERVQGEDNVFNNNAEDIIAYTKGNKETKKRSKAEAKAKTLWIYKNIYINIIYV